VYSRYEVEVLTSEILLSGGQRGKKRVAKHSRESLGSL
jgi:hypothetical protein